MLIQNFLISRTTERKILNKPKFCSLQENTLVIFFSVEKRKNITYTRMTK